MEPSARRGAACPDAPTTAIVPWAKPAKLDAANKAATATLIVRWIAPVRQEAVSMKSAWATNAA
jgi:hypothetical protein